MLFSKPVNPQLTIADLNTCKTCRCNKVCDHRHFSSNSCDNYIPYWISTSIALPQNDSYVLRLDNRESIPKIIYYNSEMPRNDWRDVNAIWTPIPDISQI